LFIGHLLVEKLLKALFIKVNSDYPPMIHNLLRLAEKSNIELTEERKVFLVSVTAFNINARYDDYKMSFQKLCTPEFTKYWVEEIKTNIAWIKELIVQ
jgi:HEPN domain-containing protein